MTVLLTGGAGYIGSHTAVALAEHGCRIIIADDFRNSSRQVLHRLQELIKTPIRFFAVDVSDASALDQVFSSERIDAVIHFAGYKAVGESVESPLKYYRNNLNTLLSVLEKMEQYHVNRMVFSSSATVYGVPAAVPLVEEMPTGAVNPYGQTKLICEQILRDAVVANPELSVVLLRYFNPVGAHESGLIGENPNGIPNNLVPYLTQVAAGIRERLTIHGADYPTADGTGVRDYIHIMDLAYGHVAALEYSTRPGIDIFNLGTGTPTSVMELLKTFEAVSGRSIPYQIGPRRSGDVAECYADPGKANRLLGWKARYDIHQMCRDAWRWQAANPHGYRTKE